MIKFPCGCTFETNDKGFPIFNPNIEALPLNCSMTWDMICDGNTKGVFQLESQLGQSKSKEVKPRNIEELSDLIAIIRPGCGDAIVKGKSLTKHYIDRKSGKDTVDYFHPCLEPILKSTYGILVFQEQAMQIAQAVAGFDLQQADHLRKAIGKKLSDLMNKLKDQFIEGAKKAGLVSEEEAVEIFGWIEKSQKYSFNKSHSISYAFNGYQTAYAKAHFTKEFFTSYLRHADGKPKPFIEINDLISNARTMDIDVQPPSILHMIPKFTLLNDQPTFGLVNIKNVGMSVFNNIKKSIENNNYDISKMNWETFLMRLGPYIKSNSFESMISAGAFDCYKLPRSLMLYQLKLYLDLKDLEKDFLHKCKATSLIDGLEKLKENIRCKKQTVHTINKINFVTDIILSLQLPPYELIDKPSWRAKQEKDLLGIELTCSEIDEYDTQNANCTCREFLKGFNSSSIAIAAKIESVREWKIKGGQNKGNKMAFLKISDGTCSLESVTLFTNEWEKNKNKIKEGKILLLRGSRDKNRGSFLVKSVKTLLQCI